MQHKTNSRHSNLLYKSLVPVILIFLVLLTSACTSSNNFGSSLANSETASSQSINTNTSTMETLNGEPSQNNSSQSSGKVSGQLKVHFIDVGQADCILLQNNGAAMLIDAGNNADERLILNYLHNQNIKKLDYVIGTHPHEDHIGSLDKVIDSFDIGKVYMPKVTANTNAFEDVITSIKNKGLKITTPVAGSEFPFGKVNCKILAPVSSSYEDLNNYSIVIKLTFGSTSFLFTGDAESISESEMLGKNYDLKADVLKVGHHGSNSSSSASFLKAVSPKYAVISVGKDNDYGHPGKETMERLYSAGITVYRTDLSGTIVATSDGNTIKFDKNVSAIKPQAPPAKATAVTTAAASETSSIIASETTDGTAQAVSNTVYITKTGSKYHNSGCKYLAKSKIPIELSEAKKLGYTACSVCKPPR